MWFLLLYSIYEYHWLLVTALLFIGLFLLTSYLLREASVLNVETLLQRMIIYEATLCSCIVALVCTGLQETHLACMALCDMVFALRACVL